MLNAFDLISFSEGFDLSPLFEEPGRRRSRNALMRFATQETAEMVAAKLEGGGVGRFRVTRSGEAGLPMESKESGRKRRLSVAAKIMTVAPSVLVVEVKKTDGDTFEHMRFCCEQLPPALKDIEWAADSRHAGA